MTCQLVRYLAIASALAGAQAAQASTWNEVGDAGSLPTTAQVTLGDPTPLTAITGTISSTTDRDMYLIDIEGGGTFSASTVGQPGTLFDSQLFLFDASGYGVYANDDFGGAGIDQFRSLLPANHPLTPLTPGLYYLLIANFGSYPANTSGVIFPNITTGPKFTTAVVGPIGPGGGSPIAGYSTAGNAETGTYTIALTGARVALIPEPSAFGLMAIATPALLLVARRRRVRGRSA